MKSERLIVLLSKEEKARIADLAEAQNTSVGELVRNALSKMGKDNRDANGADQEPQLSVEEIAALERLASVASQAMERANKSLDRAFSELEATKAYFAAKRHQGIEGE
ncbi:MAG: hypothetical protein AAF495_07080 [Pseudomonadota bacterium]